jgi:hypothetical protein
MCLLTCCTDGVGSIDYECHPRVLTPNLLSDEIPTISPSVSLQFYEAAKRDQYIDGSGYLVGDPRETQLHIHILDQIGTHFLLQPYVCHLSVFIVDIQQIGGSRFGGDVRAGVGEIMNVLWSAHELTDEHVISYLTWFKSFLD